MSLKPRLVLRWLAPFTLLALVLVACEADEDVDEAIDEEEEAEEDDPDAPAEDPDDEEEDEEEAAEDPDDVEPFTYEMGMFDDMINDSYWSYLDDTDVWSGYVVAGTGTPCQLHGLNPPNFAVTPQLATEEWAPAEEDGDVWVVEQQIHEGVEWSDGEPVTAEDMAFTWETVLDFPLGGQWLDNYEAEDLDAGPITDIEAVDETTVRIEFSEEPGLGTWPMGIGTAPIMAEHYWGDLAEEHDDVEDFLAESGQGTPSCGPFEFTEWEEGAFATAERHDNYYLAGTQYTHFEDGTVEMVNEDLGVDGVFGEATGEGDEVVAEYTTGPYAEEVLYTLYGEASVAVSSMVEGEIPFLLTGPGIEEAAQDEIIDSEETEAVINADYGVQYLGFNFDRSPMDDQAFREAVATVVDREFITDTIMGGSADPLYGMMPSGNEIWYDEETGGEIEDRWQYDDMGERLDDAVEILADAGYSWETEPEYIEETDDVEFGEGLTDPDGEVIEELQLAHPTAGYDPLRNTAGLHISDFIEQLGVPVDAQATEFSQLVELTGPPPEYDMIILGWSLGNPALPTYYDTFFRSDSETNNTAFANDDYDDAAGRFMGTNELDEAYEILWGEMEPLLAEELPYVPLFDTPNVEGYRPDEIQFPYTEVLGGIEFVDGQPALVQE